MNFEIRFKRPRRRSGSRDGRDLICGAVMAALFLSAGPASAQSICTSDCSNHPNVPAGTSCLGGLSNASGLVSYPGAGVAPCTASGTYTVWHATRFDVPAGEVTEITHLCIGTLATSVAAVAIYDATANPNQPSSSFPLPAGLWGPFSPIVNNVGNTVLIEVAPTPTPLQITGPFWVVVGYNNVNSATQTQGVAPVTATQGTSQTPALPAKSMMAIGDICSLCGPASTPTCQTWVDYNNLPVFQYTNRAPEIRPLRFGVAPTCPPFSSYSQDCCNFVCATDPTCCGSWHPGCFALANANCPTPCVNYIPPAGIYGEIETCGQSTNNTCTTAELVDCDAGAIYGSTFLDIDQTVSPPVVTKDVDWYAVDLTDLNGSGMADFSLDVITEIPLIVEVFAADPNNCQVNQVPQFGGFVPHNCGPAGHHIPGNVGFSPGQTVERFYIRVEPANVPLEGPCSHFYTIHFAPSQCQPGSVCTTATNDCYTIGGPGCNDTACCQAVCACDPFCCNSSWDSLCVGPIGSAPGCSAIELCSDCGDPAAGDCCAPLGNGTPGCNDFDCCAEVCLIDSFCCDAVGQWDSLCAFHAQNNCAICQIGPACPPATNDCFVTSGLPGCNEPFCCDDVCANDPFCCNTAWDIICVEQGAVPSPQCTGCGDPGNNCCAAGVGPHCDDAQCCVDVCALDPSCCEVEWTAACAAIAQSACTACGVPGPPNELCSNAMHIPLDTTITMDSANAQTDGPPEASCGFTGILDADLWFEFVAPCDHTYAFRLDEADGTGDRIMGLYTTGCGSPPNSAAVCDGTFTGSIELLLDLAAGETVLIRVGTPGGFPAVSELIVTGYCTGDLNGDGVVNVSDLLIYLNAWNSCPTSCPLILTCPSPVFGLLNILSQWGTCP